MTAQRDFTVYNMPQLREREVWRWDSSDPPKRERDETWYLSVRETMSNLFKFFEAHGLLLVPLLDIDQVVLRFSDFTKVGQTFVKSGAPDRWLGSFDRPGSKKLKSDVSYLEKQLAKLLQQPSQ